MNEYRQIGHTFALTFLCILCVFHISVSNINHYGLLTDDELTNWCNEVFPDNNGTGRKLNSPFNCSYQCGKDNSSDWGDIYIVEDSTICGENGQCSNGICVPRDDFEICHKNDGFFQIVTPCIASCYHKMASYELFNITMENGSPCYRLGSEYSFCEDGECNKNITITESDSDVKQM